MTEVRDLGYLYTFSSHWLREVPGHIHSLAHLACPMLEPEPSGTEIQTDRSHWGTMKHPRGMDRTGTALATKSKHALCINIPSYLEIGPLLSFVLCWWN